MYQRQTQRGKSLQVSVLMFPGSDTLSPNQVQEAHGPPVIVEAKNTASVLVYTNAAPGL